MDKSNFPKEEGRIRLVVLEFSIKIESLLSSVLRCLLNIRGTSKSFGNSGSALSFSQKANLLIDTKFLDRENSAKFKAFMEIRNQFIHNEEAKSFVTCLSFIQGRQKYPLSTYPNITNDDLEERLQLIWNYLVADIIAAIGDILEDFKVNKHVHFFIPPKQHKV